ncbi:DUF2231 domain-containing protein [Tundrisphaera sp. TA3]|uniref:DUF2231 domain-containing protein n=1 Tax=Tundrisphaera sp. TA3 TaxID=3435775 RepID=UPI003EBD432F
MSNPIELAIDAVHQLMGHSPHPAIVTVPLGAWTVSNVCDGLAVATGRDEFDDAASISMAVGLVGAAGAVVTGLRDYSHIPQDRPSHEVATAHGLTNAVAVSLVAASYILRSRDRAAGRPTGLGARLLGVAGGGASLYAAWLGGKLVEEMGEGVQPMEAIREGMEHGEEGHGRHRLAPDSPLGLAHG